jgi:hypothetical protein
MSGYVYQEFPRLLYGRLGGTLLVDDEDARDAALASGDWALGKAGPWTEPDQGPASETLAPSVQRRKPGRPRKVVQPLKE